MFRLLEASTKQITGCLLLNGEANRFFNVLVAAAPGGLKPLL